MVGVLIGAVGGTAFVVFSPRLPTAAGLPLAVLAVAALVGLVVVVLRGRKAPGGRAAAATSGSDGGAAAHRLGDGGAAVGGFGEGGAAGAPVHDSGMYGRGYRLVVAGEVLAVVAGVVVLGRLGLGLAVLPWVAFVVGLHFVALGRVWRRPSLGVVGAVVAMAGVVGFVLALTGAPDAAVAVASGVVPGATLLAGSWWAAI